MRWSFAGLVFFIKDEFSECFLKTRYLLINLIQSNASSHGEIPINAKWFSECYDWEISFLQIPGVTLVFSDKHEHKDVHLLRGRAPAHIL